MGGLVGRLFREFTLDAVDGGADFAGGFADDDADDVRLRAAARGERRTTAGSIWRPSACSTRCSRFYRADAGRSRCAIRCHRRSACSRSIALNIYLFRQMTYSMFPGAGHRADHRISRAIRAFRFNRWRRSWRSCRRSCRRTPRSRMCSATPAGGRSIRACCYISLKPASQRDATADGVVNRLRGKLARVAGARLFLVAVSDLRTGGRQSNAAYQYTLLADDDRRTLHMDARSDRRAAGLEDSERRQFRSAAGRPRGRRRNRPADGEAARTDDQRHRQHAL